MLTSPLGQRSTFLCVPSSFQSGQSSTVIENIHTIIAAAAVKFSSDQLNHLFVLIQKVRIPLNLHSLGKELMRHTVHAAYQRVNALNTFIFSI